MLGLANVQSSTAPSRSFYSFKNAEIGPSSTKVVIDRISIVPAYKSAPILLSRLLKINLPISLNVLPAKIRKLKQIANIIAVLVFLF